MKILVTGKNGQVGFELQRSLSLLGQVVAVDVAECDLTKPSAIRSLLSEIKPEVIVNPAAYTAVDRAESEPDIARAVNSDAPAVMAEYAQQHGALMVHYSTDYVFDGTKQGAYLEADATNPQSVYGATKLLGEQAVQEACSRHVILRTSWVVGAHGGNFAKTMLRLAQERDELSVVADQFGAPTSAALLADLTAQLVRQASVQSETFPYGLYHAVAGGVTNWHQYACHVIEQARAAGVAIRVPFHAIKAITALQYPTPAKRPANSQLSTAKLQSSFGFQLPAWQQGVDHILQQII